MTPRKSLERAGKVSPPRHSPAPNRTSDPASEEEPLGPIVGALAQMWQVWVGTGVHLNLGENTHTHRHTCIHAGTQIHTDPKQTQTHAPKTHVYTGTDALAQQEGAPSPITLGTSTSSQAAR